MGVRKMQLKPNDHVTPCPRCGNNTSFTLRAERCSEDCCNTWVECECGFDPTAETGGRFENVWGDLDRGAGLVALDCWNEAVAAESEGR